MTEEAQDARRRRANLTVLAVAVVLVVLGVLLTRWFVHERTLTDCLAASHRNCEPVDQPQDQ
jgi:uncharacterized ion transporter superfamily protein YfcC